METFKFIVTIQTLVGLETKVYDIKAKTLKSAELKIEKIMGNRAFDIRAWTISAQKRIDQSS